MNSQQLILDRITAAIEARDGVLLIEDRQYANTGTLRTVNAETLEQIAYVTYGFYQGYCDFGPMTDRVASLDYDSPSRGTAPWVQRSVPDLVDAVVAHLTGGKS